MLIFSWSESTFDNLQKYYEFLYDCQTQNYKKAFKNCRDKPYPNSKESEF